METLGTSTFAASVHDSDLYDDMYAPNKAGGRKRAMDINENKFSKVFKEQTIAKIEEDFGECPP